MADYLCEEWMLKLYGEEGQSNIIKACGEDGCRVMGYTEFSGIRSTEGRVKMESMKTVRTENIKLAQQN